MPSPKRIASVRDLGQTSEFCVNPRTKPTSNASPTSTDMKFAIETNPSTRNNASGQCAPVSSLSHRDHPRERILMFASFRMALSMLVLLSATTSALADTAADVSKIQGLLKRAEANLKSVESSLAGRSSPPRGSAGKLLARRLQQAFDDLQPAGKLVAKLPAGDKAASEVTTRYNEAAKLYQKLAAIMNGGQSPAPGGAGSGEVKLGYPHADNFKNTLFTYRNKVEPAAKSIVKLHAELLPVKDQLAISHRVVAQAIATIAEARRQAGFVQQGLAKIPANGQGVAAAKADLAKSLETLKGSEPYFTSLNKQLQAIIDPARYPQFDTDRKRLQGLSGDYKQDWVFTENRARAAELFAQRHAAKEEVSRIAKVYERLVQQQTPMGKTIEAVAQGTLQSLLAFDAKIEQRKSSLPTSIQQDLAEADKYAAEAVKNQKPLWFTGGIPQRMGWARDKLALLKAIDPSGAKATEANYAALEKSLAERARSLEALIIRENRIPEDRYTGADRNKVIEVAKSGWAHQQPKADILAIRIPAEAWKRQTKWEYSNGTWYFYDKSRLQVRLIVADHENPKQAIDRPVTVIKDHQSGDTMIGVPMRSFDEKLTPGEYFLRVNVKK